MSISYKIDFEQSEWQSPMAGVRHKFVDQDHVRLRLVEYSRDMPPHWCEKGHCGYLIEGEMEIEYEDIKITYGPGDGIFIPDGSAHRHKGRVLTDKALVFFIEKA